MGQIKTGSCSVTNGSATVIASVGNDWSDVDAGDLFAIDEVGNIVVYVVASDATFVSSQWRLSLSVPYAGATDADTPYVIHRDFEPIFDLPIFSAGDTQTIPIINRIVNMLAATVSSIGGGGATGEILTHSKTITSGDIGALTIAMSFGAPLAAVPFVGRPVMIKSNSSQNNIDCVSLDTITVNGYNVNLSAPAVSGQVLSNFYILAS